VSDLMMPELDGPSLYSAVTHRWPISRPQLLFVSGVANPSAYEGFLKVIHATLLPKPFKVGALRRTIKHLLQPRP
jgi:DNA-binding response OmpR family regulator